MRERLKHDGRARPAARRARRGAPHRAGRAVGFRGKAEPELAANAMLCAVNQAAYLLKRQVESQGREFLEKGGFTENLHATSSPELVVGVQAALRGQGEMTLGTVIGSNICNIVLILGVSALIRPLRIHLQVLRFDLPCMLAATVLVSAFLATGRLGRGMGLALVGLLAAYTVYTITLARREDAGMPEAAFEQAVAERHYAVPVLALFLILGVPLLVAGSDLVLRGAVKVAVGWGVSQAVIGLTLVAVGGSLPELATSVVAAAQRKGDIAVGNVIGSNIFNLLSVLGLAALAAPITVAGIQPADVAVMLVVSFLLFPLMRSRLQLNRWEGGVMLAVYAGYVATLFAR
jgi:cation:H+ antiporter